MIATEWPCTVLYRRPNPPQRQNLLLNLGTRLQPPPLTALLRVIPISPLTKHPLLAFLLLLT
jgi:hypothetical protein